jgi:hypothetical protein
MFTVVSVWAAILRITRLPRRNHPRKHHAKGKHRGQLCGQEGHTRNWRTC